MLMVVKTPQIQLIAWSILIVK